MLKILPRSLPQFAALRTPAPQHYLTDGNQSCSGTSPYTSTQRLLELGVHNTIEDIIEARRAGQLIRLGTTRTGRHVLARLG
ncbi:hypothetical protein HPB48_009134 [Haemaphysalis longicornis]|uniref:Uncharacterized protein n=1 Tax=Haemaphysalis longicornis TaxID=44386 RepID=A0A9J6FC62_HAELO|nr:hypothetical protein HPB48_009134 [Haemaphysalis longicornis]